MLKRFAHIFIAMLSAVSCLGFLEDVIDEEEREHSEDETVVSDIYDYSDPVKSGVEVLDYDMTDGSLAVTTTSEKAPKLGDLLCSGSTDQAPLGYIARVVEVEEVDQSIVDEYMTKSDTKSDITDGVTYLVKTIPARLEDLLRSRGKEAEGWLSISNGKVKLVDTGTKGIYKPEEEAIPILDIDHTFTIEGDTKTDSDDKNKVKWENYGDGKLSLSVSDYLSAYDVNFYTDPLSNTKSGMKLQFYNHFNVHLSGAVGLHTKTDDLITLLTDKLNPIESKTPAPKYANAWYPVIPLEVIGLPINITLKMVLRLPFEASISAGFDADLFDAQNYFAIGAIWDDGDWGLSPLEESGGRYFFTEEVPEGSKAVKDAESEKSKYGLYLKGEVNTGPLFEMSVGINGTNLASDEIAHLLKSLNISDDTKGFLDILKNRQDEDEKKKKEDAEKTWTFKTEFLTCGGQLSFDMKAKAEIGYEYVSDNPMAVLFDYNPNIDYEKRINDNWSFTGEANAKVYFSVFDIDIGYKGVDFFKLKWKNEYPFNIPVFSFGGTFLFPEFKNQEVEVLPNEIIKISGVKHDPFTSWFYKQDGIGYVLEKYKEEDRQYFEDPSSILWTKTDGNKKSYTMTLPIKASDLEVNVPYTLYPYMKISKPFHVPDREFNIYRKGVKFVYDGTVLRYNSIEWVEGENL